MEKRCRTCEKDLPLKSFHAHRLAADGLQSNCKPCRRIKFRIYQKGAGREKQRTWQRKNPEKVMIYRTRQAAREQGFEHSIGVEDIVIPKNCPVFGTPLVKGTGQKTEQSPSVDRIDNSRGYVKGNVVVVSSRANSLKGNATIDELKKLADFYATLATSHSAL